MNPPDQPTPDLAPTPSRLWLHFCETHSMVLTASEESDIRHAANEEAEASIRTLERELAAAKAECERLRAKQPIATDLRQFDLVRFMRQELHAANLITDEEYGWLCMEAPMARGNGSPSARRLESYDRLNAELARIRAELSQRGIMIAALNSRIVALGCGQRDDGSWFNCRAEKAEAECLEQAAIIGRSGEREANLLGKLTAASDALAKDKARLDWLEKNNATSPYYVNGTWWTVSGNAEIAYGSLRDAIDAAMKGTQ